MRLFDGRMKLLALGQFSHGCFGLFCSEYKLDCFATYMRLFGGHRTKLAFREFSHGCFGLFKDTSTWMWLMRYFRSTSWT